MSSIFQPDHSGKSRQVPIKDGMTISHTDGRAHVGENVLVHGYTGGKLPPNKTHQPLVPVHGGMVHVTNDVAVTGGGKSRTVMDGGIVPVGRNVAVAGFGNGGLHHGDPTQLPAGTKNTKPVAASFGQRSRVDEVGTAILKSALLRSGK